MAFIGKSIIVDKTEDIRNKAYRVICEKLPEILMGKIFLRKAWENKTSAEFVFEAYIISPLEMNLIIQAIKDRRLIDAEALLTGVPNPNENNPNYSG